jgi:RNA polymerase sigma-70 factor (ECF subfamily)
VERAQQGDRAAIGELFSRYWRAARAAAFGVTGAFSSAEDAAAEAFVQALASIHSLRDPDRFGAWLRTIVVRKARLDLDRRHTTLDASADSQAGDEARPDHAAERRELEALVREAMRDLPEPLREAVALFYFEGYDSDAAARFLDIPPGTLRRRLHDGRIHLRTSVKRILQGSKLMNEDRKRHIERVMNLIDDDKTYEALRESLALRPPPSELIDMFVRRRMVSTSDTQDLADSVERSSAVRETAQRLLRPSARISDASHPVGAIAMAIRNALPSFQNWTLDLGEAVAGFWASPGEYRDRLRAMLPPGFAEGHPGAFLRATGAVVVPHEEDGVRSVYELLRDSPDKPAFRAAAREFRISDALELTWMVAGPLDLRVVQELLEGLSSAVLPNADARFSPYDEPRYRSALQVHLGNVAARAACGGVLNEWPGRPAGVSAAHVRIFLEPWATAQSGHVVSLHRVPHLAPPKL